MSSFWHAFGWAVWLAAWGVLVWMVCVDEVYAKALTMAVVFRAALDVPGRSKP